MWPALVAAGSSLLGGFLGKSNNDANIAAQQQINAQNIAMQKEFAQHGIQWKVEDAKAAGINPLAALGASTSSFSNLIAPQSSGNPLGDAVSKGGQDIARALKDTMAAGDQHSLKMMQLQETRGELENQLLASQIAKYNAANAGGPPTPSAGQTYKFGLSGQYATVEPASAVTDPQAIKVEPNKIIPGTDSGVAPGISPMTGFVKQGGFLYPVLSDPAAKAMSNDSLGNLMFRVQNELGFGSPPSEAPAKGYMWEYLPTKGWFQMPKPSEFFRFHHSRVM